jgi:hypothetical protein
MKQLDTLEIDGALIADYIDQLAKQYPDDYQLYYNLGRKFIIDKDVYVFHKIYEKLVTYKTIAIASCEYYIPFKILCEKYLGYTPTIYSNHYLNNYGQCIMFGDIDLSFHDLVIIPDFEHFAPIDMINSKIHNDLLAINWSFYHYKVNNNLAYTLEDLKDITCIKDPHLLGKQPINDDRLPNKNFMYILGLVIY